MNYFLIIVIFYNIRDNLLDGKILLYMIFLLRIVGIIKNYI